MKRRIGLVNNAATTAGVAADEPPKAPPSKDSATDLVHGTQTLKSTSANAYAVALGFTGIAAWLYISTVYPTVGFGDSGELVVAAHAGGIAHPPGYPLMMMLGRVLSSSASAANASFAYVFNVACACIAACAGGLIVLLCWRVTQGNVVASVVGAAMFCFRLREARLLVLACFLYSYRGMHVCAP